MNVRIFGVRAMKCMCAQTRPPLILSSERVFGGMEFEPMLTPREKSPLPENFPRGGSNQRRCGQRAQTLPTSYSGPLWLDLKSVTYAKNLTQNDGGGPIMLTDVDDTDQQQRRPSAKTECDYLNGWILKRSHTQKSHQNGEFKRHSWERRRRRRSGLFSSSVKSLSASVWTFVFTTNRLFFFSVFQLYPQKKRIGL